MANILLARSSLVTSGLNFGLVSPDERKKSESKSISSGKLGQLEATLRAGAEQQQAVINAPKSTQNGSTLLMTNTCICTYSYCQASPFVVTTLCIQSRPSCY